MKWSEAVSSRCRYGDVATRIWSDWDVIWEDAEDDYQGHASFIAEKDGKYCFYEWWYGSCSGCDGWEADGKDDDAVEKEMRDTALWMDDRDALVRWLDALEGNPRSNASVERGGGLAFGIDFLGGGLRDRINAMRKHLGMPELPTSCTNEETAR